MQRAESIAQRDRTPNQIRKLKNKTQKAKNKKQKTKCKWRQFETDMVLTKRMIASCLEEWTVRFW